MNNGTQAGAGDGSATLSYRDVLRVGPGTIGGAYLRRFWHPVFIGRDLAPLGVKPIRILGEDLTLYRAASGAAHIVARRCPHRGVHLSLGFVEGENIQCAYHAWQFDASGACVAQPAEPKPFCHRVSIKAYPTQEYLGLIFVYLGEGEAPPLPRLADFENDEIYDIQIAGDIWPCSYFDLLENATDMAHTAFLHWQFGYGVANNMQWHENECGMFGTFGGTGKNDIFNNTYFDMPTAVEFTPARPGSVGFFTRGYRVPCDDNTAIRYNLTAIPRVDKYIDRRGRGNSPRQGPSVAEVSRGLVEGLEDMRSLKARGDTLDGFFLTNVQDCSVLSSLGAPADRDFPESLGGCDGSIAMMRRLFVREMTNLSQGKPLKEWKRPDYLWKDVTAMHREMMTS
jgi:nitrite reductase/ring-hydroxylating ferredoxin subunit